MIPLSIIQNMENKMQTNGVTLKPGKDKAIRNHHLWIFSGAVQTFPKTFKGGSILPVHSSAGEFLGQAYFNRKSDITGRMVAFDETPILEVIHQRLKAALELRNTLFNSTQTNGYRLINGEGDGLPGLVIDIYNQVVVIQISTLGMDRLKSSVVDYLIKFVKPIAIYEKSNLSVRKREGLKEFQGFLYGDATLSKVEFLEYGLKYEMELEKSQKTGFFLDHRDMRQWVKELSKERHVLNAFSYTGGFTVSALAGGAKTTTSVDISQDAVHAVKKHVALNGFNVDQQNYRCEDVFKFLRDEELSTFDLVILDPPAFAKKQQDLIPACRGYKDINRLTMQKMAPKSLLLSCSCSHHVNDELFQKVLFQAATEAKRTIRIIGRHRQAQDHPINIFHPESHYLKSFLLYIE